ncbi:MAG: CoA transferase [Hyphomicrobiaceae bacterium]|nr:CoA transferase [Hyphomicrobiaceae bacterium]
MTGALDGIHVIDLSSGAASALATMFLSDHGATVVRVVDKSAPDFRQGGFVVWDRGKQAVRLDIDSREGADALERLIAGADILVEDIAPSDARQRLVDRERLARLNPRLIACSITAYGKRGPWRDEPPIEDLVMARTGLLGGLPGFRPAPVHCVHPLPSVGAALLACNGIAAALLARETTQRGRSVESSLMAGALLYMTKADGEKIKRHVFQTHPAGSAPFYSLYECADGNWVQLGCVHETFIAIAADLFGLTELIKEPRMVSGRAPLTPADDEEMRAAVATAVKRRPLAEWVRLFEDADVPFAPARLTEEGFDDPQVLHNQMVMTLDDPAVGPVVQMGVPVVMTGTPGAIQGPRQRPTGVSRASESQAESRRSASTEVPRSAVLDPPPLAGIRVLEITNLIAGPTAGRILADLGADVIKLEPPAGDISRPIGRTYFYALNFNKRSVCVDTSTEEGRKVVQAIAAKCDVLLANLRPKATERMGIGPAINPRLIETHLTGYGFTGPYSKRPGIDPLAQAYMGMSRAQGGPENPPVFPAQLAPTDYTNGAMGAFGTILALYVRARSGVVQRVEGNLLSGGILLSSAWFTKYRGRPVRQLADKEQMGLGPFHRLFKLADGWIYVAADAEQEQRALCEVAGVPSPARAASSPASGRHPNEAPIAKALASALSRLAVADVLDKLHAAGVPAAEAPEGHAEIFLEHPHAIANDMVAIRQHPTGGKLRVQWRSVQFSGTAPTLGRATPLLGEHTTEVMAEVGIEPRDIERLAAGNIVKVERPR